MCEHGFIGACAECDGNGQQPERDPAACEDPACGAELRDDGTCSKCGVSHTHEGCPECGRHGFHKDGCSLIGEYIG